MQLRIRGFAHEFLRSKHHGSPVAWIDNVGYDLLRNERRFKLYQLLGVYKRCNWWSDDWCASSAHDSLGFCRLLLLVIHRVFVIVCRTICVARDRLLQPLQVEHSHLWSIVLDWGASIQAGRFFFNNCWNLAARLVVMRLTKVTLLTCRLRCSECTRNNIICTV